MMDAKNVNIPNLVNKFAGSVMQGEASPEKRD